MKKKKSSKKSIKSKYNHIHRDTHNCMENAVPYHGDGPLGHGWECGICGKFLQAG